MNKVRVLFIDRDGTLARSKSGFVIKDENDIEEIPAIAGVLGEHLEYKLHVVSNVRPGFNEENFKKICKKVLGERQFKYSCLSGEFSKPSTRIKAFIEDEYKREDLEIDWKNSIMIGDTLCDEQFAKLMKIGKYKNIENLEFRFHRYPIVHVLIVEDISDLVLKYCLDQFYSHIREIRKFLNHDIEFSLDIYENMCFVWDRSFLENNDLVKTMDKINPYYGKKTILHKFIDIELPEYSWDKEIIEPDFRLALE